MKSISYFTKDLSLNPPLRFLWEAIGLFTGAFIGLLAETIATNLKIHVPFINLVNTFEKNSESIEYLDKAANHALKYNFDYKKHIAGFFKSERVRKLFPIFDN